MEHPANGHGSRALSLYLREVGAYPVLTKKEELTIGRHARRQHGAATATLIQSNLRFVAAIAREYMHLGLPLEDLLSEGNIGLLRAAARFDPAKGMRFITYASWWVRKCILRALADQVQIIRIPTYQRTLARRYPEKTATGRFTYVSINDTASVGDRPPLLDALEDSRAVNPEDEMIRREALAWLRKSLAGLTGRERMVIARRFGLTGSRRTTLKEVGASLGLSKERVRQIESRAIGKLRSSFERTAGPPPGRQRQRSTRPGL